MRRRKPMITIRSKTSSKNCASFHFLMSRNPVFSNWKWLRSPETALGGPAMPVQRQIKMPEIWGAALQLPNKCSTGPKTLWTREMAFSILPRWVPWRELRWLLKPGALHLWRSPWSNLSRWAEGRPSTCTWATLWRQMSHRRAPQHQFNTGAKLWS